VVAVGTIAIQGAILPVDGGLSHLNTRWGGDEGMGASVQFCDVIRGEDPKPGDDMADSRGLCGEAYENTEASPSPQSVKEDRLSGMGVRNGAKEGTASDSGKINEKSEVATRNLFQCEGDWRGAGKSSPAVKEGLLSEIGMRGSTQKAAAQSEKNTIGKRGLSRDSLRGGYGKEGNLLPELAVMRSNSKNVPKYQMAQVKGTSDGNAKGQVRHNTIRGEHVKGVVSHDGKPAVDTRGNIGNIPLVLMDEGAREPSSLARGPAVDRISPEGFPHIVVQGERCVAIDDAGSIRLRPSVLIGQIADTAGTKLASESGRIRMVLNPPQLGTVDMDVSIRNNKVCAVLHTDSSDVRHALQSNMEQLKISFHNQGLTVDSISVFLHDKSEGSQYGFTGKSSSGQGHEEDESQLPEDREDAFPVKEHPCIDGCINVFA
jgi:hypothetical protein